MESRAMLRLQKRWKSARRNDKLLLSERMKDTMKDMNRFRKYRRAGILFAGILLASPAFGSAAACAMPYESGAGAAESGYVFPKSNIELLTAGDFAGMTKEELRIGRNEIYARHGRRFRDAGLQQYFDAKSWYRGTVAPESFSESVFNIWEKQNVGIILDAEQGAFDSAGRAVSQGAPKAEEQVTMLTQEELDGFNRRFRDYCGFFTCTYDRPTGIDWANVLYDGLGTKAGDYSTVADAYLAATGEDEVYTDITTVTKAELEDYVRQTTGTEYSQAEDPLDGDWVWLPGLQAYAFQHGDTNRQGISFYAGEYSGGDTLRLYFYLPGAAYYDSDDGHRTAVLRKNGSGGWWFYSCTKD